MHLQQNESGRSMVEMLGVLGIMGVLSLIGIRSYRSAMDKHQASTLLNEANKRAVAVSGQIVLYGQTPDLNEFNNNTTSAGTFSTQILTVGLNNRFAFKVSNVSKKVCESLQESISPTTPLRRLSQETDITHSATCQDQPSDYIMVYNNDLSGESGDPQQLSCSETPSICPLNAIIAGTETNCPCTCPDHRTTTDGVCGGCTTEEQYVTWKNPFLSENGSMGEDSFACAAKTIFSGRDAYRAFDNSTASDSGEWHSLNSLPQWLSWYNPDPIKITSMIIKNRPASSGNTYYYTIKDFELQYSDDNINWTTVATDQNNLGSLQSTTFSVDADTAHRYWRLYITSNYSTVNNYVSIGELKLTGQVWKVPALNSETLLCE